RQNWRSLAEMGSLAGMVVHELRNQLGGLKLYATFLRKQLTGPAAEHQNGIEIVDKIIHSINVMTDYSGLLTQLTRPVKLSLEHSDLRSLIENVLHETSAQAHEVGVTVSVVEKANSHLPLDRSLASRALTAVVSRAISASAEGGTIEITS